MSAPAFKLRLPPASLFKFPPDANPAALPPPTSARTFAAPFAIDQKIYNDVLDWRVPITVGAVYMTSAVLMNKINRDRKNVPWGFSKTAAFHYFVIAHNVFLAIFSGLTFFGMIRALAHTWPGRRDLPLFGKLWPGLRTQNGLAGAADALCKLHGPRDLGDAVFYDPLKDVWTTTNRNIKLAITRIPDTSDVGRLWNEGLAFWGWWFYLSKFYEVLDTFIILAKGKRSSTLQTYHHTGAMACMWAGIRFMSPPIWMFCFLNSGIHTLMYTYYTLAALRVRVPQRVKRTLTTMQITQFLVGMTFATLHLFVYYSVPVAAPFTKAAGKAMSAGASAVSAAASRAPEVAAAAAPSIGAFVRKYLLRAAGEEGMAQKIEPENFVHNLQFSSAGKNGTGATWRTQFAYVPCIDTTGQAFAIWLNVFYLAPLTLLFARFFIRSYFRRGTSSAKPSKPSARITKAAEDAAKGTNREVDEVGKAAENAVGDVADNVQNKAKSGGKNASGKSGKTNNRNDAATTNLQGDRSVSSDQISDTNTKLQTAQQSQHTKHDSGVENAGEKVAEKAEEIGQEIGDGLSKAADEVKDMAGNAKLKVEESMSSSKLLDSYSIVDRKELESSMHEKSDPDALLQKIEDHEAPTFAEVADPEQSTHVGESSPATTESDSSSGKANNEGEKDDSPSYAEVADPDQDTNVTASKPDLARSTSPHGSQRSSSPSKKSAKSKIPQPKHRASASPTKKAITPAKATTSMAAHSGTALVDKDTSTIGNA